VSRVCLSRVCQCTAAPHYSNLYFLPLGGLYIIIFSFKKPSHEIHADIFEFRVEALCRLSSLLEKMSIFSLMTLGASHSEITPSLFFFFVTRRDSLRYFNQYASIITKLTRIGTRTVNVRVTSARVANTRGRILPRAATNLNSVCCSRETNWHHVIMIINV
jgi:hypothetical protein